MQKDTEARSTRMFWRLRAKRQRGNAIIELALLGLPMVGMLMGTVVVGLNIGRSIQTAQVNRDAGSMYVRGVDFSATFNRNILIRLGQGLGLANTGGRGVVYLSKITWIPASKCVALGNPAGCNSNTHAAFAADLRFNTVSAVVIAPEAIVRSGPLEEAKVLHQFRDGIEVTVLDQKDLGAGDQKQAWLQVRDGANRSGWLKSDQVAVIGPTLYIAACIIGTAITVTPPHTACYISAN